MYKKYIVMITLPIVLLGCNFLDFDESIGKTDDIAYGYFDELSRHVTHIYGQMSPDWGVLNGALMESATDNAVYTWQDSKIYDVYNNAWSSINLVDNKWNLYYTAIRSANLFLHNYSLDRLKRFENNINYKEDIEKAEKYPYEVRFLRAFFYFELAKRYGNIPLLTTVYEKDKINSVSQTPFDSIVQFIANECDSIIPYLPANHRTFYNETGRVTKGAAMALKSRALLYAASPLHNLTDDLEKWGKAAKAAGDLISVSTSESWYFLDPNVNLFSNGNDVLKARELIFERRGALSSSFEETNLPIGFYTAKSGNTPTQNLVDAFEMIDGTPFDWSNPEHAANPYLNRDPRLAKIIVYNGAKIINETVETFKGGKNATPIVGASLSGYYLRKYIDARVSLDPVNPVQRPHHFVLFRYAEVFLNYAEALNEYKGPDYTDDIFTISARDALNRIRTYVRMPLITDAISKDSFRERVKNERRVELAFEDHRFWDIRRWKIGEVVNNIYGISIEKNNAVFTYEKKLIQRRVWDNKMYLYPIPKSELFINSNLSQNPGWE
ncbi:MAG: RagB/SusD family nutrient uptake outer membrane protein [Paludibacter sp.]|nr:RagB/SusD family nutrient uptake outer membrane protein [Paludibacter sp.]